MTRYALSRIDSDGEKVYVSLKHWSAPVGTPRVEEALTFDSAIGAIAHALKYNLLNFNWEPVQ